MLDRSCLNFGTVDGKNIYTSVHKDKYVYLMPGSMKVYRYFCRLVTYIFMKLTIILVHNSTFNRKKCLLILNLLTVMVNGFPIIYSYRIKPTKVPKSSHTERRPVPTSGSYIVRG